MQKDTEKTKAQLIDELNILTRHVADTIIALAKANREIETIKKEKQDIIKNTLSELSKPLPGCSSNKENTQTHQQDQD